jgi:hypothetical protein
VRPHEHATAERVGKWVRLPTRETSVRPPLSTATANPIVSRA